MLDKKLTEEIREKQSDLDKAGQLFSLAQLETYYKTFHLRFGPEQLRNLDGEDLLNRMHAHGNHDSLVYWLEFKDDDELPAVFGSIAGGSALKFGIYKRKETGAWMTGSPANQLELSIDEAVKIARRNRDQLIKGAELLEALPRNACDQEYATLQLQMSQLAPHVSDLAWGHKYFSLLYPEKLDDYHNPDFQRFHLIKLLQTPPLTSSSAVGASTTGSRYVAAGRYVAIAAELNLHLNQLTTILNKRNGRPHNYWYVVTNYAAVPGWENHWEPMRNGGYAGIGWAKLGDLSDIKLDSESQARLHTLMKTHYGDTGGWAQESFNFVAGIDIGDIVLAIEHSKVLGIGRVTGLYSYDQTIPEMPHHRTVEWLSEKSWELPTAEIKNRVVREIRQATNLVEIERIILGAEPAPSPPGPAGRGGTKLPPPVFSMPTLNGIPGRIQSVLGRKGQCILYGPPGTGKTYWALLTARELAAYKMFGREYKQLTDSQKTIILGNSDGELGMVRVCSFHPAYGYEDFLEGYKPKSVNDQLIFELRDGIFKRLCRDAYSHPDNLYYLVIDEINRGDIPRIFGELLMLLEKDKRGTAILMPLSGMRLEVPANVYLIGTMNTADRSIALLDTALRRRFGFVELMPDPATLGNTVVGSIPLKPWLEALNQRLVTNIGRDARNLQVGHAYLLEDGKPITNFRRFARVVQDDILPLLQEYCYEDYQVLEKILGKGFVDANTQLVHHELFDPMNEENLVQALLAPCPEIATTSEAVSSEGASVNAVAEDDPDGAINNNAA